MFASEAVKAAPCASVETCEAVTVVPSPIELKALRTAPNPLPTFQDSNPFREIDQRNGPSRYPMIEQRTLQKLRHLIRWNVGRCSPHKEVNRYGHRIFRRLPNRLDMPRIESQTLVKVVVAPLRRIAQHPVSFLHFFEQVRRPLRAIQVLVRMKLLREPQVRSFHVFSFR